MSRQDIILGKKGNKEGEVGKAELSGGQAS